MNKVYITQDKVKYNANKTGETGPQFDFRPLLKFGEPIILLPARVNFFVTVPVVRALRDKLATFSDDDYLVPIGDPSIMGAAVAIACNINGGRAKILKWDRQYQDYIPVQLDISGKEI